MGDNTHGLVDVVNGLVDQPIHVYDHPVIRTRWIG